MNKQLDQATLLNELQNLKSQARVAFEKMENARILYQKHLGAIDAVSGLLQSYFPEEKPNESPSVGEKPAVA